MNKKWLFAAILAALLALAAVAGLWYRAAVAAQPKVEERWALYVEGMKTEGKLVVLSTSQRFTASKEFTSKLLAVLKIKASIELSAWADVHYFVEVEGSDPARSARWKVAWDRKSKSLALEAPQPDFLPPAVRTETIEIETKGANLVTNSVFRLKEEALKMRSELSADLARAARVAMDDPEVREKIREGVAKAGKSFCTAALGIEPSKVTVRFAGE